MGKIIIVYSYEKEMAGAQGANPEVLKKKYTYT